MVIFTEHNTLMDWMVGLSCEFEDSFSFNMSHSHAIYSSAVTQIKVPILTNIQAAIESTYEIYSWRKYECNMVPRVDLALLQKKIPDTFGLFV